MRREEQIIQYLKHEERVNKRRVQCTAQIARVLCLDTEKVRFELKCLENAGIVKRYKPWTHRGQIWWELVEGSS